MKTIDIRRFKNEFKPIMKSAALQAAMMSLKPGKSSSEKIENEHPRAEQWLFVVSGTGVAKIGKQRRRLSAGVLLLIPKRVPHQITNTGETLLTTLNFYSPPAYAGSGDVLPSANRG